MLKMAPVRAPQRESPGGGGGGADEQVPGLRSPWPEAFFAQEEFWPAFCTTRFFRIIS